MWLRSLFKKNLGSADILGKILSVIERCFPDRHIVSKVIQFLLEKKDLLDFLYRLLLF